MSIPIKVISGLTMASIVMGKLALVKAATTKGAIAEVFMVDLDVAFMFPALQFHPLLTAKQAC